MTRRGHRRAGAVNARGTRVGGGVQFVLTAIKVGSLVGIIALPFVVLAVVADPAHRPTRANLAPIWPADWAAVDWGKFGAALVGGAVGVPRVDEHRAGRGGGPKPQRNIPLALLGGVVLLIVLYVGANLAYYLVIPRRGDGGADRTPGGDRVLPAAARPGRGGGRVGGGDDRCSGRLNGNMLVGPRLLFAMARDRLAPAALGRLTRGPGRRRWRRRCWPGGRACWCSGWGADSLTAFRCSTWARATST